jgi:hypothetical protein
VVFDFRIGRERAGPKRFLGNFEGILQTNGYAAYDHVGGPKMVHAACWAHARRKFFQAVELNPEDQCAIGIVAQMDKLFGRDQKAREQGLSREARHAQRLEKAQPLLEQIKSEVEAARSGALPKSVLAKACNYTLMLWTRLTRFLEYPQLELSNNWAGNAIRPVALGRKNWIHIGREEAGPRVAAIVSIMEACLRLSISVRDYQGSVLPGLANFSINRIAELTPIAWKAQWRGASRDLGAAEPAFQDLRAGRETSKTRPSPPPRARTRTRLLERILDIGMSHQPCLDLGCHSR